MTRARALTQVKRSKPKRGIADGASDWAARSVLTLSAGRKYRMRNGHTAKIERNKVLEYAVGQTDTPDGRQVKRFVIWYGRCVECGEALGWNANGTYAAIGKHPLDLIRAL